MTLDQISAINERINRMPYASDAKRYASLDYWCQAGSEGGDCEDYAIAKLRRLVLNGFPIERFRLACCYVETGEYHAVLVVSLDDGDYMLDNRQQFPVPVSYLDRIGYKPHVIQKVGGKEGWAEWKLTEDV